MALRNLCPASEFPHPRGDGPYINDRRQRERASSPPAWGWSDDMSEKILIAVEFPTRVGMDRCNHPLATTPSRVPHPRGDGPQYQMLYRWLRTSSPPAWGWTANSATTDDYANELVVTISLNGYHPSQHGSASIKAVLPAFTDLSYEDLAIQEGGTASSQFLGLLKGLIPKEEISKLRENLLKYCERDTMAMVILVEKLRLMLGA